MEAINRSPLIRRLRSTDWTVASVFIVSALLLLAGLWAGTRFGLWEAIDPGFIVCIDGGCDPETTSVEELITFSLLAAGGTGSVVGAVLLALRVK